MSGAPRQCLGRENTQEEIWGATSREASSPHRFSTWAASLGGAPGIPVRCGFSGCLPECASGPAFCHQLHRQEVGWAPRVGSPCHITIYSLGDTLEEKEWASSFSVVSLPCVKFLNSM